MATTGSYHRVQVKELGQKRTTAVSCFHLLSCDHDSIPVFLAVQYSDRPPRFGPRYRRRSQESDSDESPGRSDHNSSSERDEAAFDNITDILKEIQENMRKILEKLRRLETSLEQNHDSVSTCAIVFVLFGL